jgi:hypothetical protein
MPSRVHTLHDLGKQLQSANLTTQRQQVLEALPVVATNDRQIQNYHKTSKSTTSTAMIALPRRSGPCRPPQRERNTSAVRSIRAYPTLATKPTKHSKHRAPTIVLAIDPRGPQFRRQRRKRRIIASAIANVLGIVPSNKEAHQERDREGERDTPYITPQSTRSFMNEYFSSFIRETGARSTRAGSCARRHP